MQKRKTISRHTYANESLLHSSICRCCGVKFKYKQRYLRIDSNGIPGDFGYCSIKCVHERIEQISYEISDYNEFTENCKRKEVVMSTSNIYSTVVVTKDEDGKITEVSHTPVLVVAESGPKAIVARSLVLGATLTENTEVVAVKIDYQQVG